MLRAPKSKSAKLVSCLLDWFATNARDLPWRRTSDPYAIWVSEIMLQQTQVKTVMPYWERWMRELPTIQAAAKASPAKLHKLWEGLGYYTRVRNLQKAAQQIISCRGRGNESLTKRNNKKRTPYVVPYKFPEKFEDILALPGIGRYTAGAIASIAFNQPRPILDGNVIRVLTRIFGITANPRDKETNAQLWQLAEELVLHASRITNHTSACSHLNQSLMELGALICTPRAPQCLLCPVSKICEARKQGLQEQLPNLGKREAATVRRFTAFVVEHDGKFLVRQRPAGVVNAHLWEFPNIEVTTGEGRARQSSVRRLDVEQRRARSDAPYRTDDFRRVSTQPLCTIKHSITRYRITLEAHRANLANPHNGISGRWLTLKQLHQLAFTSAHKKILGRLEPSKSPAKL